jgi:hypothetical protein
VIGLPTREDTDYIALWNTETNKQFITGMTGNLITKIHCSYGKGIDHEELIAFYAPAVTTDGELDLTATRQIMKKSVALVGALFKKIVKASNVDLDSHSLITGEDVDKVHHGMPDYEQSETLAEAERKRIENTPFSQKKIYDLDKARKVKEDKEEKKEEKKTEHLPATVPGNNVKSFPGQGKQTNFYNNQRSRTPYRSSTYKYDSSPTWFGRRPNQYVRANIAKLEETLKSLEMERPTVATRKPATNHTHSAGKIARTNGGAAGTICIKCYHYTDCQDPIPAKNECKKFQDRDEMYEVYGYGGMGYPC